MGIAMSVQQYLADCGVEYELISHPRSNSSAATAELSHVPGDRIAKGVVMKDERGYVLAVVPASHHVEREMLDRCLGRHAELASEREIASIFSDCELGAIPPVGFPYGVEVVLDESLEAKPEVYFEAGDHMTLVHLDRAGFRRLMRNATHGRFSVHG